MSIQLIIKEEASIEIKEAYMWYEEKQAGLGDQFVELLDHYFDKIISTPQIYPVAQADRRVAFIRKFPFKIVFESIHNQVIIYAVFHTSRNPKQLKT